MESVGLVWNAIWTCPWVNVIPSEGTGNTNVEIKVIEEAPINAPESALTCTITFKTTYGGHEYTKTTCVKRCPRICECPEDDSVFSINPVSTLPKEEANSILIGTYSGSEDFMNICLSDLSVEIPPCGCNTFRIYDIFEQEDEEPSEETTNDSSWISEVTFINGEIYAKVEQNNSNSARTSTINVYFKSGEIDCDPISLQVSQAGNVCSCNDFGMNPVQTITAIGYLRGYKIGTYNFDVNINGSDLDACYEITNISPNCDWVDNVTFNNSNKQITADIFATDNFGVLRECVITVTYNTNTENNCSKTLTVKQLPTAPIVNCTCNNITVQPTPIAGNIIVSNIASLTCGGQATFKLAYGSITSDTASLTCGGQETFSFKVKENEQIGTYQVTGDCDFDANKLEFVSSNPAVNNLSHNNGKIYATISDTIVSEEVTITAKYDGALCDNENASFKILITNVIL